MKVEIVKGHRKPKNTTIIDEIIKLLDKYGEQNPTAEITIETPNGTSTCRISNANIYEDDFGNIIIDAE